MTPADQLGSDGSLARDLAASAIGAGAGLAFGGPLGAFLASISVPLLRSAFEYARQDYLGRKAASVAIVTALGADQAGIDVDELLRRARSDPEIRELLELCEAVATETALAEKLLLLGVSLGVGAQPESDRLEVEAELMIVRALRELDQAHIAMLSAFWRTPNELGLGDGSSAFDGRVSTLNDVQLLKVLPELASLTEALIDRLDTVGLVRNQSSGGGGMLGGGSSSNRTWTITELGEKVMTRLHTIALLLSRTE